MLKPLIWRLSVNQDDFLYIMTFVKILQSIILACYKRIRQTLQTSIDLHNEGFKTWYSGVKLILSEVSRKDNNLDQVKNNLKNRYKNIWFINFHKENTVFI